LLISEEVLKSIEDITPLKYRKLGNIKVKGRSETVSVYKIIPEWKIKEISDYQNDILCFELGLDYYQAKNYKSAIAMLKKALGFIPEDKASFLLTGMSKEKKRSSLT